MSTEDLDHGRFGPADNDYHVKFSLPPSTGFLREGCLLVFFLFCLFVVIKPENPYSASSHGSEVNPLGVYPLGSRVANPDCTTQPGDTLRAN